MRIRQRRFFFWLEYVRSSFNSLEKKMFVFNFRRFFFFFFGNENVDYIILTCMPERPFCQIRAHFHV